LHLRPGQRVLEVGSGSGRLAVPASRRVLPGGAVVALDIQPKVLQRLRPHSAPHLIPVLGNATEPHFRPASFDTIYMCTVLGEIPEREAALRQCYEALKPGGLLSITEILPDPHFQSRATVRRLAEAAGFQLRALNGNWRFFTANFVKPG
jgi:ubiquinone/menaquinone biosynthesis C-methylase UbiE